MMGSVEPETTSANEQPPHPRERPRTRIWRLSSTPSSPGPVESSRTPAQNTTDARMVDEHGYPTAEVDGFTIGMFTSFGTSGDAWVEAPDGSIATLIWGTGDKRVFREERAPERGGRWGTYAVELPLPMTTDEEAAAYLRELLLELRPRWEKWGKTR